MTDKKEAAMAVIDHDDDVQIDERWLDGSHPAFGGGMVKHQPQSGMAALERSDLEMQLDAAHRYPRVPTTFLGRSTSIACRHAETAASCIYAIPRGGKTIVGPSIRLAEIMASTYGNLRLGGRVVDVEEKHVIAEGIAWDLETNVKYTVQVQRKIVDKNGRRYNDDMITVTGQAAISIALRNAIFRAIPRAYVDEIFRKCQAVSTGGAKGIAQRIDEVMHRLTATGIGADRVLARVEAKTTADIDQEKLVTLIGLGTAIKAGDIDVDAAFPPLSVDAVAEDGGEKKADGRRRMSLKKPKADDAESPLSYLLNKIRNASTADDLDEIGADPALDELSKDEAAEAIEELDKRRAELGVKP